MPRRAAAQHDACAACVACQRFNASALLYLYAFVDNFWRYGILVASAASYCRLTANVPLVLYAGIPLATCAFLYYGVLTLAGMGSACNA